ncbi:MAG: NUDIX domain-containing protein [Candidatus Woykebacteria bacterium]
MKNSRNIKSTVTCFIHKDDKWLMLRRSKDRKYLPGILNGPGGKIGKDEGILEAAKRELMEETRVKAVNLRLKAAGVGRFLESDDEYHFKVIVGEWFEGDPYSDDGDELAWMRPEEILADGDLLAELRQVFEKFIDPKHPTFTYKSFYTPPNNLVEIVIEK